MTTHLLWIFGISIGLAACSALVLLVLLPMVDGGPDEELSFGLTGIDYAAMSAALLCVGSALVAVFSGLGAAASAVLG